MLSPIPLNFSIQTTILAKTSRRITVSPFRFFHFQRFSWELCSAPCTMEKTSSKTFRLSLALTRSKILSPAGRLARALSHKSTGDLCSTVVVIFVESAYSSLHLTACRRFLGSIENEDSNGSGVHDAREAARLRLLRLRYSAFPAQRPSSDFSVVHTRL
jgi:hypothetical protein